MLMLTNLLNSYINSCVNSYINSCVNSYINSYMNSYIIDIYRNELTTLQIILAFGLTLSYYIFMVMFGGQQLTIAMYFLNFYKTYYCLIYSAISRLIVSFNSAHQIMFFLRMVRSFASLLLLLQNRVNTFCVAVSESSSILLSELIF